MYIAKVVIEHPLRHLDMAFSYLSEEFVVDVKTRYVGKMLSDIGFKNNVLIASISRKGKIIFPKGDDTIEIGDRLIVVTKERKIEKINDIFD